MHAIDTLLTPRWLLPIIPRGQLLLGHSVAIDGGKILDLLPTELAQQRYDARERIDLPDHLLMPGLVNAHCHAAMNLMRGIADDLPLMTWLSEHIWPAEAALICPEYVRDGVDLAAAEMLRGGTTAVNDMYFFPEVAAEVYRRRGMRAALGMVVLEFPTPYARDADEYLSKGLAFADSIKGEAGLLASLAPHAPYTVSDASLQRIRVYADQMQLRVHMHIHETAFEVEEALRQHGRRPLARLKQLGFVGADLTAVHMTQLTAAEIADCARHGVVVAHCPESNLKLASGFCPVAELLAAGVEVAIGTDGAASNNDLDSFAELRSAALLAKAVALDASAMPALQALHAATMGGAKALGMEDHIGSIEPGKCADLIAIDFSAPELAPVYNPISHLVYAVSRRDVSDVWTDGVARVRQRQLLGVDLNDLQQRAQRWALKAEHAVRANRS